MTVSTLHLSVSVLFTLCHAHALLHHNFHPLLTGHQSAPSALRIRLLPPAVQYLNHVGARILAEHIPHILIPNITHRFSKGQGGIHLSRVRVSRFKRASSYNMSTSRPNKITWLMRNVNIGLIGDLSGEVNIVVPLKLEGQAEVQAEGVDLRVDCALEKSPSGSARVRTVSCRTTIKAVHIDNHNGGLAGLALNIFKMAIGDHIRPLIQSEICREVTRFIDEGLNRKLARTQTKSSLATAVQRNSIGRYLGLPDTQRILSRFKGLTLNASNLFGEQLATKVFIDYRLTEDPVCYSNTVELSNLGHISIKDRPSDTPFGVPLFRWPSTHSQDSTMVEMLVSDYVPNALLYHVFKDGLLKFVIDGDSTASLSAFLRTACLPSVVCFADVLPQFAERFPNSSIQLVTVATRAPTVIFSARDSGVISMNIVALVFVFVLNEDGTRRQAAIFQVDMVGDTHILIQNSTVLGKVDLRRFHLEKKSGDFEVSNDEISDVALLSSEMLQNFVNNMLRSGFPIPIPKVVQLTSTNLMVLDRRVFLSSRFVLDSRRVSDIASSTIFGSQAF